MAEGEHVVGELLVDWFSALTPLTPTKGELTPRAVVDAGDASSLPASILWLRADKRFDLQRVCEAVSLLTLLQHADPFEWRQQVARMWPNDSVEVDCVAEAMVMGVEIRSVYNKSDLWQNIQDQLLRSIPPSETFASGSQRWLPRAREHKRRAHLAVPLRIELQAGLSAAENAWIFKQTRDFIEAQHSRFTKEGAVATSHPHFLLEAVQSEFSRRGRLNGEALLHMRAIQECGVRPPRLRTIPRFEDENSATTVTTLRSLLSLDAEPYGVDTVELTKADQPVIALLSAMQHSPSVKAVDIRFYDPMFESPDREEGEDLTQEDAWRWIACCLFSKFATHAIEELQIYPERLTHKCLNAIRDVLRSENPLADLIEGADRNGGWLSARKFYLSLPPDRQPATSSSSNVVETNAPIVVQILNAPVATEDEWWRVWLPAYGVAFVHSRDILEELPFHQHHSPVFPRPLRKVTFRTWDYELDFELRLLQLIGDGPEELTVITYSSSLSVDNGIGRALAVCSQLKVLTVEQLGLPGLQVFVDSAIAGHAKLQRLVVSPIHVTELDTITRFFQALEDPTHPLTQHLKEVELTFEAETYNAAKPVWRAALSTLRKNRSLRVVTLIVKVGRYPFIVEDAMSNTAIGQLEECAVTTGPLPLPSKIAFLSVVADHPQCLLQAVRELDTLALSRIFEFAVTSTKRRVTVMCTGSGPMGEYDPFLDEENEDE